MPELVVYGKVKNGVLTLEVELPGGVGPDDVRELIAALTVTIGKSLAGATAGTQRDGEDPGEQFKRLIDSMGGVNTGDAGRPARVGPKPTFWTTVINVGKVALGALAAVVIFHGARLLLGF